MKIVASGYYLGMSLYSIAELDANGIKTGKMLDKCTYRVLVYDRDMTTEKYGLGNPSLESLTINQDEMTIPIETKPFSKVEVSFNLVEAKDENKKIIYRRRLDTVNLK